MEKAIAEGRFREDLYHRLNEFTIEVPPLRECRDDILPLAAFFLKQSCAEMSKTVTGLSAEARKKLQTYGWPGNVRELKNIIRKAVLLCESDTLKAEDLDMPAENTADGFALKAENEEKEKIIKALETAKYNKALAAGLLRISRPTLYEKMKKYGIEPEK